MSHDTTISTKRILVDKVYILYIPSNTKALVGTLGLHSCASGMFNTPYPRVVPSAQLLWSLFAIVYPLCFILNYIVCIIYTKTKTNQKNSWTIVYIYSREIKSIPGDKGGCLFCFGTKFVGIG